MADAIAKCRRVLDAVDAYCDLPTSGTRQLRSMLMDELQATDPGAMWDRFIAFIQQKHGYTEVKNVMGGTTQLRRDFIAANASGVVGTFNEQESKG